MADVQIDHGNFTQLANELVEALSRASLHGRQFQVMLAIIRLTYGWQKAKDRIASSQVAQLTELDVSNVRKTMRELVALRMLECSGGAGKTGVWRIQKDYEQWVNQGRRQPRSWTTQVVRDPGHVRPGGRVVDDPGTRVVDDPDQRKKETLPKKERAPDPAPPEEPEADSPERLEADCAKALRLIATAEGSDTEKRLWLRRNLRTLEDWCPEQKPPRKFPGGLRSWWSRYLSGKRELRAEADKIDRCAALDEERRQMRRTLGLPEDAPEAPPDELEDIPRHHLAHH